MMKKKRLQPRSPRGFLGLAFAPTLAETPGRTAPPSIPCLPAAPAARRPGGARLPLLEQLVLAPAQRNRAIQAPASKPRTPAPEKHPLYKDLGKLHVPGHAPATASPQAYFTRACG